MKTFPVIKSHIPMENAAGIQLAFYSDLKFPNTNQKLSFTSYIRMVNFALHWGCKKILELGAGLSTAVWAKYAEETGTDVYTVDADFGKMMSYIEETKFEPLVKKNITCLKGFTIGQEQLIDFYKKGPVTGIGGIPAAEFIQYLELFKNRNCYSEWWDKITRFTGKEDWEIKDFIIEDSALSFPDELLDIYSAGGDFKNEINYLGESAAGEFLMDRLSAKNETWDLIFFDSGEFSSLIEWIKLKENIAVEGLAVFHDIFFPKSFKNFLVCASVIADPDWRVLCIDDTTQQGLMIAQKQKNENLK